MERSSKYRFGGRFRFYIGDYWILDHADDYSWSIVGELSGRLLWILTRESRPSAQIEGMLYQRAAELGYDTSILHRDEH